MAHFLDDSRHWRGRGSKETGVKKSTPSSFLSWAGKQGTAFQQEPRIPELMAPIFLTVAFCPLPASTPAFPWFMDRYS